MRRGENKLNYGAGVIRFMCHIMTIVFIIALLLVSIKRDSDKKNENNDTDYKSTCTSKMFCKHPNATMSGEDEITSRVPTRQTQVDCYPDFMKKYGFICLINITAITLIGGLGNLLNLVAIPYVYYRYPKRYPRRWNQTTLLMLHLSVCDLAYIVFGISAFFNIYSNNGLFVSDEDTSNRLCWLSAMTRHLIAYADFITLSYIAYVRMGADFNTLEAESFSTFRTVCQCCSTWIISFIIISPMVFKANWFGIDWGEFGPNPLRATCNTYTCSYVKLPFSPPALIYTVGFFVPFFIILIAYLVVLPIKMRRAIGSLLKNFEEDELEQFTDVCSINRALWILVVSYLIFAAPLVAIEWLEVTNLEDHHIAWATIVGYNWYWWIFAINFIVYLASLEDFREMYAIFLSDCISWMCIWNKPSDVDDAYNFGGRVNSGFEPPPDYETSQGSYRNGFEMVTANSPRYRRARSCFQEDQIYAFRRSSSAPPFKRRKQQTSNPRAMKIKLDRNPSENTLSDMETSQVKQRKFKQLEKHRNSARLRNQLMNASVLNKSFNSRALRLHENVELATTSLSSDRDRRLLAASALQLAFKLEKRD